MNQVTVVADTRLEEAVVHVVVEIDGFAIGRVFVFWPMQVGHAFDILGEHRWQADGHCVGLEFGQRVVADVKIPQRVENAFAAQRGAFAEHFGEDLRLVTRHSLIAGVDAILIFVLGAGSHPCGKVAGVLVEKVVDALLQTAPDHRILFCVEADSESLQSAATKLRLIHLPVVPAPHSSRGFETNRGNGVVEVMLESSQQPRIVGEVAKMLIEYAGSAPAGACVGRCERGGQLLASRFSSLLAPRKDHAQRVSR